MVDGYLRDKDTYEFEQWVQTRVDPSAVRLNSNHWAILKVNFNNKAAGGSKLNGAT